MRAILTWLVAGVGLVSTQAPAQGQTKEDLKTGAVQQLQRKLAERETSTPTTVVATNLSTGRALTFAEIENLYVDGKITAREFQVYVNALRSSPPAQPSPNAVEVHDQALTVLRKHEPDPAKNPAPGPAITLDQIERIPPQESPVEERIAEDFDEIVNRMDELIKSKEAREKIKTKQLDPSVLTEGGKSKSKRERLNDLLRLHVYGELSKEDYDKKRAEIIAEPE